MWKLSIKSAVAHWRRLALTTVAIVLGVTFVVGSFVLSDSLSASINRLIDSSAGKVDLVVRPSNADVLSGPQDGIRSSIPADLQAKVSRVAGVEAANTQVIGAGQIVDGSTPDAATGGPGRGIAIVTSWPEHPSLTSVALTSGAAPTAADEVAVDSATAATKHLKAGDPLKVATLAGVATYRITGIFTLGTTAFPRTTLAFPLTVAPTIAGLPDRAARIAIKVAPGADQSTVQRAIAKVIPSGTRVVTEDQVLAELRSQINQGLAIFTSVLLGFAAVTLFVSTFLIWNTFNIVVAQRTRELALLRAIGASERQVAGSVIGEGVLVGVVASAIGVGTGILTAVGMRNLLGSFGAKLPDAGLIVQPRTFAVGMGVGVLVTLFSVLGPARRATSIPPVAAMQQAAVAMSATSRRRTVIGLVVLVVGFALGAFAMAGTGLNQSVRSIAVGIGAVLLFLSVASLSSHLVGPVLNRVGAIPARLGSAAADLARRNAVRAPRRVASTAAALMVGLALVGTTLVVGESIKYQLTGALTESLHTDLVVQAGGVVPIDAATQNRVSHLDGVVAGLALGRVDAKVAGDDNDESAVTVVDTSKLLAFHDPDFTAGSLPTTSGGVAISKPIADAHHLHPGSRAVIATASGQITLKVTGVYQRDEIVNQAIVTPDALNTTHAVPTTRFVFIHTTGDTATIQTAVNHSISAIPSAKVFTATGFVSDVTSDLDTILAVIDGMLVLAVGVAALGIANTLALSIVERTRELGLLRALGMDRRSMRRMVRVEGVLLAIFGGILGVSLGIMFGVAVVRILPPKTAMLSFPVTRLAMLFASACALGFLASIVPALRAGKLAILDAIADA